MKRRDLAQQYFPESSPRAAVKGLLRWIDNCPELVAALEKLNIPFRHKINLTARQVRIIMYYLGDPWGSSQLIALFSSQLIALFSSQLNALFSSQLIALFSSQLIALFSSQLIALSFHCNARRPKKTQLAPSVFPKVVPLQSKKILTCQLVNSKL